MNTVVPAIGTGRRWRTSQHVDAQEAQEINNDYILNPELNWVKVPERLTFTTAFLKIPGDVRAMAIAVYVAGIGHAASENDPIIDATLLPTMLGAPEDPVRLAVGQLITVGLWQPVDAVRVDTGMGGQLRARAEAGKPSPGLAAPAPRAGGGRSSPQLPLPRRSPQMWTGRSTDPGFSRGRSPDRVGDHGLPRSATGATFRPGMRRRQVWRPGAPANPT